MTRAKKLVGSGRSDDFVHAGQEMAADDGFRNVSRKWLDKTVTYERALQSLAEGHARTADLTATVGRMAPAVDAKGRFVLRHADGRDFRPTRFAAQQMAGWAKCGAWFAASLLEDPEDEGGRPLFERDRADAETLAAVFRNGFRRLDQDKPFLWRTRKDGTLRAMLTPAYCEVSNEWLLESLRRIVPGGRVSHWRGDCDTVWGNVLIPDTIRGEPDSDYGGMLSVGNSEIGERELSSVPSVFRAICMNGCIWDRKAGQEIRVRHRGKIELGELFMMLKGNLEEQIPLIPSGIEKLLGTRQLRWDGASVLPLFAQVARQHRLSKRQATGLLKGYNEERAATPDARSLFGLVNAVTRAGQKMSNADWVRMDVLGGELACYGREEWEGLTSRAGSLKAAEVEDAFASAC